MCLTAEIRVYLFNLLKNIFNQSISEQLYIFVYICIYALPSHKTVTTHNMNIEIIEWHDFQLTENYNI